MSFLQIRAIPLDIFDNDDSKTDDVGHEDKPPVQKWLNLSLKWDEFDEDHRDSFDSMDS